MGAGDGAGEGGTMARSAGLQSHSMSQTEHASISCVADDLEGAPARTALLLARISLRFSTYPGRRLIGAKRRKMSLAAGGRRFAVTAADGTQLDAWFSPARRGTQTPGQPKKLPVVLMHGWIETKEFHFPRAWRLNRAGHDVILFDHRAHGCSQGRCATFGVLERQDAAAVIAAATEQGLIRDRYISFGYSMGAATAIQHAPMCPRVAAVVAFAPFGEYTEAINSFREKFAPWIDRAWLMRGFGQAAREAGFELREASTLEAWRRLNVPVLMVEGDCDTNLPPCHHTQKLAKIAREAPLELITIQGATHCGLTRRTWPKLDDQVAAFCGRFE